tara:strand:+ start:1602 stop:1730 length:129 start_codon:yes stop_codon:yes gene_type:complete
MKKPKAPKGGGLQTQKNYARRLKEYAEYKRLKDKNKTYSSRI